MFLVMGFTGASLCSLNFQEFEINDLRGQFNSHAEMARGICMCLMMGCTKQTIDHSIPAVTHGPMVARGPAARRSAASSRSATRTS